MRLLRKQKGFTLIELVMIIVILGILAAVAIPLYIDLAQDADHANAQGVVGALNSAASIAFSQYVIDPTVNRCGVAGLLNTPVRLSGCLDGGLPANWVANDGGPSFDYTDATGTVRAFAFTAETAASKARVAIADPPW